MKRVLIISDSFVPSGKPGVEPTPVFRDSVVDLDDQHAGLLIISGRAQEVDPEQVKLRDTSKERNREAAAVAASTPENLLASAIATAVAAAVPAAIEAHAKASAAAAVEQGAPAA